MTSTADAGDNGLSGMPHVSLFDSDTLAIFIVLIQFRDLFIFFQSNFDLLQTDRQFKIPLKYFVPKLIPTCPYWIKQKTITKESNFFFVSFYAHIFIH